MYRDIKFCVKCGEHLNLHVQHKQKGSFKVEVLVHIYVMLFKRCYSIFGYRRDAFSVDK